MILFALSCATGHAFEAWFRDGSTYDEQAARGLVRCPTCDCPDVRKAVMAPNVVGRAGREPARDAPKERRDEAKREDVGPAFVETVRRMHDGDIPTRPVSGEATVDEARELWDDGILVLPLDDIERGH